MKILNASQMQRIDAAAINTYLVPEIVLMENAGIKTVLAVCDMYPDVDKKSVLVVAGPGNNGGDGFVIARHLHNIGASVNVVTTQQIAKYKGVCAENIRILEKMNVPLFEIISEASIYEALNMANFSDLVIDAIFGTGLGKKVEGLYLALINGLNGIPAPKVAVDIPSGIDGSTGLVMGAAIKAACTVTFAAPKVGHVLDPGSQYIGRLFIADISIPNVLLNSENFKVNLTTEEFVKARLKPRPRNSNKGDFGRALLIGGSKLYSGAPAISCSALLKSGAGLSFLMVPDSILPQTQAAQPDPITIGLISHANGHISACHENIESVLAFIYQNRISAVGIGMGMTDSDETGEFVSELLAKLEIPVCLDADGLWCLKKHKKKISANAGLKLVVTPHPKEMAKLIDTSVDDVLMNRLKVCEDFSRDNRCVTLLKGHRTVICDQAGISYINASGNSAMAKGGMGDALTGLITGFLALGMPVFDAAICGAYIHGKAGDMAADEIFEYSMTTADLIKAIPEAMSRITGRPKRNSN